MKGVILAGGLGTRLFPLTKITNKHLLPVYDRPMIHYPLKTLADAGVRDVMIVTGGNHSGEFLRLIGNGKEYGLNEVAYAYQEGEGGIADALALARPFVKGDRMVVILGDNIIEGDIRRPVAAFAEQKKGARILLKKVSDPERFGVPIFEGDRVTGIEEKPKKPQSEYAVIGIYMYDGAVFDIISTLKPSDRNELEITDVNNAYVKRDEMQHDVIEGWWTDAGTFESLFRASQLVRERMIEKLTAGQRYAMRVLVTGGAGFIGSHYAHHAIERHPDWKVTVLDKLTYAGNPANLADLEKHPRYRFVKGDIAVAKDVVEAWGDGIDLLVNFAAETHVDRSIGDPEGFIRTDIYGAYTLLETARERGLTRFVQISTDEVYGSVKEGASCEDSPLMPSNPYSASKAGADRLAYSYFATYGTPVVITRASNNFGSHQYPEKMMPLFITNALDDQPLPVYGDGQQIRDWLHVRDHCEAIDVVIEKGALGEVYNIGGGNERKNIDVTRRILERLDKPPDLLRHVTDRPGHDRRYALDCSRLHALGWAPKARFEAALDETIAWYRSHRSWWEPIKSGEYRDYYRRQYGNR